MMGMVMVMAMEGSLMRMGLFINERKMIIILALDIFDMTMTMTTTMMVMMILLA